MIPPAPDPNNPLMMPGMKPPPPSPSLGFQLWASDPSSALKVQPSMIAPNAPLQPNAPQNQPMASFAPPQKPPMALASPPQIAPKQSALMPPGQPNLSTPMQTPGMASPQPAPADAALPDAPMAKMNPYAPPAVQSQGMKDRTELQRLQTNGAGLNQIKNPWLRGLAKAGDIAGTILAPNIAAALPGTTLHNRVLQGQQTDRIGQDDDAMKAFQEQQQFNSQQQQNQANLEHTRQETLDLQNKPDKADQFDIQSTDQGLLRIDKTTGEAKLITDASGKAYGPADKAGSIHDTLGGLVMVDAKGNVKPVLDPRTGKQLQGNLNKPPVVNVTPPKAMVYVPQPDGSSRAMEVVPGTVIPKGASTLGANGKAGEKINSDEQKRADMARNINDNIDQLEEILNRRPELFGPVAGRLTGLKNSMGSDDPDIGSLMTIRHNLGMVGQSVHGMRSAQGVESQANALVNSFHNSPQATKAALESMRKSAGTFLNDETNRVSGAPNTPPTQSPMVPPNQGAAAKSYSQTATGPNGHKIGSNDGKTWFDVKSGKAVK